MMIGRRKKITAKEQGSDRRRTVRTEGAGPTFSYYASRSPDQPRQRSFRQTSPISQIDQAARPKRRVRRWATQLPMWLLLVVVVVCVIKVVTLSTNPKIVAVGTSSLTASYQQSTEIYAAAAQKLLRGSIANHTKLTADLSGTAKTLEKQFPELQNVSLTAPLIGSRPILYIQLAQPSLVLQTNEGIYALNNSGIVLAKLSVHPATIPNVVDQSSVRPQIGQQYLPSSTVSFMQTVAYQLQAQKIAVSTFVLPPAQPYEVDVRLTGKTYLVRCNLEGDALTQSGGIVATIQQLGSTTPSSYLDMRSAGRVYYK